MGSRQPVPVEDVGMVGNMMTLDLIIITGFDSF